MRQAASLFRHNRFARLFAVVKCAELLLDDAYDDATGLVALRIESETTRSFDDLVETRGIERAQHGWQVKQQSTPLDADVIRELLRALIAQPHLATGTLGTADLISIAGAGHLRTLRDLCSRLSAEGAVVDDVVNQATQDEAAWLQFAVHSTGSRTTAIASLSRLRVYVLGDERILEGHAKGFLPGLFARPIENILHAMEAFISSVDGTIEINAALLRTRALQHLAAQTRRFTPASSRRGLREQYLSAVIQRYKRTRALETIPGAGLTPTALLSQVFVSRRLRRFESDYRSLQEWLRVGSRQGFVIVGEVGCGKSSLLHEAEYQAANEALADERAPMPLLVRAHELNTQDPMRAVSNTLGLRSDIWEALLAEPLNQWVLLVDGADEVVGNTWASIERFAGRLRDEQHLSCLVVATRPVAQPEHAAYDILTVEQWDAVALDELLERWMAREPAAVLALTSTPYFESLKERLLLNPLMATLCLLIAKEKRTVPAERSRVFVEVVELLFEGWRRSRPVLPKIEWHNLRETLGKLALRSLHDGAGLTSVEIREALRVDKGGSVLPASDELQRELGLLVPRSDGCYDFVLRSFAEYLAGSHLVNCGKDPLSIAHEGWSEEITRHAIGLIGLDNMEMADLKILKLVEPLIDCDIDDVASHVRPLLIALRTATDFSESLPASHNVLVDISARLVLDEDSAWIGNRIASELRAHARSHTGLWQACFTRICPHIEIDVTPARWQHAHLDGGDEALVRLLRHGDPDIRAMALRELSNDFVVSNLGVIVSCLFDDGHGWGFGVPAPAVMAAWRLRDVPRAGLSGLLGLLRRILATKSQLLSGVAAVALRSNEEDATSLARALHALAQGYQVPPGPLEDLEKTEAGLAALTAEWPDRHDPKQGGSRWYPHRLDAGGPLPAARPASPSVVARIMACFEGALRHMPSEFLPRLLNQRNEVRDLVVCRALLDGDFRVLEVPHVLTGLSAPAQRLLSRAAVLHPPVRAALLEAWQATESDRYRHASFAGAGLEGLVHVGDEESILVYSCWLRCFGDGSHMKSSRLNSRLLEHPRIREAAECVIRDLVQYVSVGRIDPDGRRVNLAISGLARFLGDLQPVWKMDGSILEMILEHLQRDDSNDYRGALLCLDNLPLDEAYRVRVKSEIFRKIAMMINGSPGRYRFEVLVALRWLQRNGFESDPEVVALLSDLARREDLLSAAACAMSLSHLAPDEAARRSTAVAEQALGLRREDLSDDELRGLVSAAPRAWCDSLRKFVTTRVPPEPATFVRVINALPIAYRVQAAVDVFAAAAVWSLPWTHDEHHPLGRPADLARMIVFDAGYDLTKLPVPA